VIVVDDEIHGMMSTSALSSLLNKYKENGDTTEPDENADDDDTSGDE
jgi:hypothetical protein